MSLCIGYYKLLKLFHISEKEHNIIVITSKMALMVHSNPPSLCICTLHKPRLGWFSVTVYVLGLALCTKFLLFFSLFLSFVLFISTLKHHSVLRATVTLSCFVLLVNFRILVTVKHEWFCLYSTKWPHGTQRPALFSATSLTKRSIRENDFYFRVAYAYALSTVAINP